MINTERTFGNLKGIRITEYLLNSDGEPIKDTAQEKVVLFNTQNISEEKVVESINSGFLSTLEEARFVVVVDEKTALALADKEKKNEVKSHKNAAVY